MLRIQLNQPKATFEQHLAKQALLIKEQIKSLPLGRERELLSRQGSATRDRFAHR
jgi:hypothetical protein